MSFTIELYAHNVSVAGHTGFRSQRAAEKHLSQIAELARQDAARYGIPLSAYRIAVFEHAPDCGGRCPDETGLAPGCRDIADHQIEP